MRRDDQVVGAMKTSVTVLLIFVWFAGSAAHAAERTRARGVSHSCVAYYAALYEVPVELVEAVIQVESAWNPHAVSKKGAAGLMQLMPETALRFGVRDRFDIEENIRGGVAYLAWLIHLFKGDLRLTVAAYQVGESQILSRGLAYSRREVFDYVTRVAQVYRAVRRAPVGRPGTHRVAEETRGGQ